MSETMTYLAVLKEFSKDLAFYLKIWRLRISWSWFFRHCCRFTVLIALSAFSYFLVSRFVVQSVEVVGDSMYPTLINSGHYWLDRYSYLVSQPHEGDIVALRDPQDNMLLVKRIIGVPGQSICLKNGKVYVDGRLLHEPYLLPGTPTYANDRSGNEVISYGDKYFVMGDNRQISMDSRYFKAVPLRDILGKVVE